ncbi:DUF6624 domain-containing protein [Streptomyces triculaminicus]|uniref:DUF6624 domain-containing protein n=1 Tax=Streptomyces triculaminicus TaxID=2816232 RepID=UPI0037D36E24
MKLDTRPPVRLDLLVTLTRLHREGVAARMTRSLIPTRAELLEIVQWEWRSARELTSLLDAHGWPGPDLVGEVGAEAAWWIALLCDRQSVFQQSAHQYLLEAVERGDAPPRHLAYFTDRMLMHEGRPQLYGTQYVLDPGGAVIRYPVADPGLLGLRRYRAGLPKTAEARPSDLRLMALTRLPRAPAGPASIR